MKRITLSLKKYAHNLTYLCVLCFLFFASNIINAQVGINNTDPKASLDITTNDPANPENTEGLLVPRVSTFPTSNPGADQNGMLVYLTTTAGLNTPGFYFWNQATTTWIKFTDSSVNTSDADFFEEGTTTAPDNINDNIFTMGNVAIGKNTADYSLDILSNTSEIGANVLLGGTNNLGRSGFHSNITNSGNGFQYGIFNEMDGTGSGRKYGVHNVFDVLSSSLQIGVNTEITNDGGGSKYGIRNILNGAGTASRVGVSNNVESTGNGVLNGVSNFMDGTGNGSRRGTYNSMSGSGSGEHIGTYNLVSSSGTGNIYGIRNQINSQTGNSTYGLYNLMSGGATGSVYGVYSVASANGNGNHYGVYSRVPGSGSGAKYGSYNFIPSTAGGNHYGVYSEVLKPGTTFAGYFLGNVSIGTTSSNNYIFPASRGTADQIIQADGTGNLSWVDVNTIGVQKINDLSDGKSDDDGSGDGSSIFLGINAGLVDDATDNKNISIGYSSLTSNVDGQRNIAIGYNTLNLMATGSGNTAIGAYAMTNSTFGQGNVAIGQYTLENSNGSSNNAVGNYALQENVGGHSNNAFGGSALNDNVGGYDNNAFGFFSLNENVSGAVNNAFGSYALQRNKAAGNNAFGASSLRQNSDGTNNSAFGSESLTSNLIGNYNNSFGYKSSEDNETGSYNSAFGTYSLQKNIAGSYNAALGNNSGQYVLGDNNVFLGVRAGRGSSNHTKSGSVMIGYSAGYNETGSNKLYIENSSAGANNALIYGEFDNNIFRVNGELQLGLTFTDRYAFPTADGTTNQILQTDGSGQLSWVDGSGLLSASNGLSVSGGDVILGGTLTQATIITHGTNNFIHNLNSSGDFFVQDAGVNVFEVRNNGSSYFGNDTFWKDVNTSGINLAALIDDGDDGRFILYEDGSASVDLDANTSFTFNEQGLDRDFRIEGDTETNLFRIDAANNRIGIMDSTPNFDIHLKQSTTTQAGAGGIGLESSSSTNNWKIYHSGTNISFSENGVRRAYITAGTGAYVPTSDRRLKKSITEVESILDKVNQLKAFRYLYKDQKSSAKKTIGFMAQDVQPLFPELVEKAEDGYFGLNYAGFGVVAIKALQEQQKEIEKLKIKNQELEDRLSKIEAMLSN